MSTKSNELTDTSNMNERLFSSKMRDMLLTQQDRPRSVTFKRQEPKEQLHVRTVRKTSNESEPPLSQSTPYLKEQVSSIFDHHSDFAIPKGSVNSQDFTFTRTLEPAKIMKVTIGQLSNDQIESQDAAAQKDESLELIQPDFNEYLKLLGDMSEDELVNDYVL